MAWSAVFSNLHAPDERLFAQEAARARLLPGCCGTYAFYDRVGEPLYIGKAKNVRLRVQSHFRATGDAKLLLPPWTKRVARIEMRCAASEMEALLVEADLVARLGPPFNRQMRSWRRYCYLVATDEPAAPLSISCQLQSWKRCFGPFRTRSQAVRIIEAVFRLVSHTGGRDVLAKCYGLLSGEETALVAELELQQTNMDDPWAQWYGQIAETLQKASQRAVLLRKAEEIINGLILMPGVDEAKTIAFITNSGLHLARLAPSFEHAEAFLQSYRERVASMPGDLPRCLPKEVADCACVAAYQMRRPHTRSRFMPMPQALGLSAGELLGFAFGDTPDASGSVASSA